jgi:hypothetical protein
MINARRLQNARFYVEVFAHTYSSTAPSLRRFYFDD